MLQDHCNNGFECLTMLTVLPWYGASLKLLCFKSCTWIQAVLSQWRFGTPGLWMQVNINASFLLTNVTPDDFSINLMLHQFVLKV